MDDESRWLSEDARTLSRLGYVQELQRRMSGFSNFAVSLSMICILAGGITSFPQGLCSVGGAAIGLAWPLVCLFSLIVAATMAHIASAFPTAGGLYHWASILGGRGFGWITAWLNLIGLVALLAAINLGTLLFTAETLGAVLGWDPTALTPAARALFCWLGMIAITGSQAAINHRGIRLTMRIIDFSGYWILAVSLVLTLAMLAFAPHWHAARLVTFRNYSGAAGGGIWPPSESLAFLFLLSFLLPAYTITGFDASAHTSEETIGASSNVPRGILRSVLVSGCFGWLMLAAVVLAVPDLDSVARHGEKAFIWAMHDVLPAALAYGLLGGIAVAQYFCGLATVTSASRMVYAFARDGGLPASSALRRVSAAHGSPATAIWTVAIAATLFTFYTPVYETMAAVCAIFLYLSYVLPTALGFFAHGRHWTRMGPWHLGRWYKPLAALSVLGCGVLIAIGMQPPNDKSRWIVAGALLVLVGAWLAIEKRRFPGPPKVTG